MDKKNMAHSMTCHVTIEKMMCVIATQIPLMIWSNIKSTTLASQTKLDSFSSPCELCDYDRDMAVQIKKHVESMHIDLVHTFRSATKREHTFVFRLHIL